MSKPQPPQSQKPLDSFKTKLAEIAEFSAQDMVLIEKAFLFVQKAHEGHNRCSGEPYLVHLTETAKILAELGVGSTTVAAGLLHDCVEDAGVKNEECVKEFGPEIAFLVDGVTKLGYQLEHIRANDIDNRRNESLRKLFVATSEDIRVLLIKLADRLHNMRTLFCLPLDKRQRIALETLEIYAPIAYRLGIRRISRELEDLAFPYIYPEECELMKKIFKERHMDKVGGLEKFARSVKKALAKEGMTRAKTDYRIKGLYSFYKKYLRKNKDYEKIYDVNAMRVLVDTISECYQALGIIHGRYRPLPNRIKDYIAFPKPNGYQALHTTVFTGDGNIVEVQIKTHEMNRNSEYGIASHLSYKEKDPKKDILAWVHTLLPRTKHSDGRAAAAKLLPNKDIPEWISELATYEEPADDQKLFHQRLRSDFFNYRIFAFSPIGDVIDLPIDSTPIDFAYAIHSDIGNRMTGAKVNGKLVSLDTTLENGDIVFILTNEKAKPNRKWLDIAKTSIARRHIRHKLIELDKKLKSKQ